MDVDLGLPVGRGDPGRAGPGRHHPAGPPGRPGWCARRRRRPAARSRAVLATWRQLLDRGSLQAGEPHLAGTAKTPVAVLSPTTAAGIGVVDGAKVTVRTARGAITLPARLAPMPDGVVWLPANSPGLDGAPDARRSAPARSWRSAEGPHDPRPGPDAGGLRHRPVLAGAAQGRRGLRAARGDDAVLDRVRAQDRRPHAGPERPQPGRPARLPAEPGRRAEAGVQGGDHPGAGGQAGLLPGPGARRRCRRSWRSA